MIFKQETQILKCTFEKEHFSKVKAAFKDRWPVVYIIEDDEKGQAYIGESTNICTRICDHWNNTERRALELEHVSSLENLFFIGIRSIEPDEFEFHKANKIQVKTAYDCYHEGIEAVAEACRGSRLLDMGLIPGTKITVVKLAPLGDPIGLSLRGYELSIRKDDAGKITLED